MHFLLGVAKKIDTLNALVAGTARWALLANALLITMTALARKVLSIGWSNAYDMQWHFFAAVVLLMAADTFRRDEHVRIDIFANRLGERGLARLDLGGIVLVLLPVCAAMVSISFPDFLQALRQGTTHFTRESTSDLPAWIIKSLIPLGFFLLGLQGIAEAVRCVAALRGTIRRPLGRRRLLQEGGHVD